MPSGAKFSWNNAANESSPSGATQTVRSRTMPPEPPRNWVGQTVSSYNLKWADLRPWLLERYKKHDLSEFAKKQAHYNDVFFFYAPEKLTEADRLEIDGLRIRDEVDVCRQNGREKHSPDPIRRSYGEAGNW